LGHTQFRDNPAMPTDRNISMKPKIIILQSASPRAPQWIRDCMHTVEQWADLHSYEYLAIGDELFEDLPISMLRFSLPTRSDLGRLQWIRTLLHTKFYDAVYWIDADFLIWNQYEFELPMAQSGAVVCAREATFQDNGDTNLAINNSIVGLCCEDDALRLIELTEQALEDFRRSGQAKPRHTIAGTDLFSARSFPIRRITAKQAGCFSKATFDLILGPWQAGRFHLWSLSLAHGATLRGANLCSSRSCGPEKMSLLISDLIQGTDIELGRWRYFTPVYRVIVVLAALPDRIRCWTISRFRSLRTLASG
jgi:hypothetical protein